jgi:hypothetical protein
MSNPTLQFVQQNGDVKLSEKLAGKQVIVEEIGEGVWHVKTATVIPDNEKWLHEEPFKSRLDRAIVRAGQREASPTDLDEFEARVVAHLERRERGK